MIPDRLPPHSHELEQVVIGSLLTDSRVAFPICSEIIGKDLETFYDLRHQLLYDLITGMCMDGKPVQMATVCEQLRLDGNLDRIGGIAYLAELEKACISPAGVGYFAESLIEYRKKRQMISMAVDLASRGYEGETVEEMLAKAANALNGIAKQSKHDTAPVKELVLQAVNQIESCHAHQGRLSGLATGFVDLDKMTSGLHKGDMVVIAGRPSTGKTSLAMNIAEYVAVDQKLAVGVFSLEMTAESLVLRMLCSRARVNLRNIREGFLAERDFPKLTGAASKLANSPLYIDDAAGLSVFELRARAKRMADQHKIQLLVIDYLQLMRGTSRKNDNRQTEVAEISNGIKATAKELNIPVIAISQLNRDMEREKNRRPRLSDLRESGSIEQDADVVGMLWRPVSKNVDVDEDETNDAAAVNLTIAKQRNGPTGDVPLTFLKGYTRFESAAKVSSDDVPTDPRFPDY